MIYFLLGASVLLNIIFSIVGFLLYRDYKMKMFLNRSIDREFWK